MSVLNETADAAKTKTGTQTRKAKAVPKPASSGRVPDLRPDNLEDARREILRLVCLNSAAITQVVIDDALEGKYLSAKFLFETVGLCAMNADEVENPERKESLTSLLLKRWQLAAPGAISVEVTEVPDGTTVVGTPIEAPVES